MAQERPFWCLWHTIITYLDPSWSYVGPCSSYVGPSWNYLGSSCAYIGPSWGYVDPSCGYIGPCSGYLGPSWGWVNLGLCWANLNGVSVGLPGRISTHLEVNKPYLGPVFIHVRPACPILALSWPVLTLSWPMLTLRWPYFGPCWPEGGLSLAQVGPMLAHQPQAEVGRRSTRGPAGLGRRQGASSHASFGSQPKASGKDTGCGPVAGSRI